MCGSDFPLLAAPISATCVCGLDDGQVSTGKHFVLRAIVDGTAHGVVVNELGSIAGRGPAGAGCRSK